MLSRSYCGGRVHDEDRSAKCPRTLTGHFERCLRDRRRVFFGEVPRQKFVDPIDRVLGDAGQGLAQMALWIGPFNLAEPTSE